MNFYGKVKHKISPDAFFKANVILRRMRGDAASGIKPDPRAVWDLVKMKARITVPVKDKKSGKLSKVEMPLARHFLTQENIQLIFVEFDMSDRSIEEAGSYISEKLGDEVDYFDTHLPFSMDI